MVFLFVVAAIVLSSVQAGARTWRVEKDGSGDFEIIQDAVDVAASGDTVRVGLGRFADMHWVVVPGWSDSVCVRIEQEELTLIGSGPETIIGPDEPWGEIQGRRKGVVVGDYWGNRSVTISGLSVENMAVAFYMSYESIEGELVGISECTFRDNNIAVYLLGNGGGAVISGCEFNDMVGSGYLIAAWNQGDLDVEDCRFELSYYNLDSQRIMACTGVRDLDVRRCDFLEGVTGFNIAYCEAARFESCLFVGQRYQAIFLMVENVVQVSGCKFEEQACVARSQSDLVDLTLSDCAFEGIDEAAFDISYIGSLTVNGCDLQGGVDGIVNITDITNCDEVVTLDMTGNYWGTADADSIEALIRDNSDSPDACYLVDYSGFLSESTPTEKKSLGDLKSLFR